MPFRDPGGTPKLVGSTQSFLEQQSPTYLVPGTLFMDDNLSMDQGRGGMVSG